MGKSYACRDKKENALRKGDFYPTPRSLVWASKTMFERFIPNKETAITECCCGNGSITKALKEIGYTNIIENDAFNKRTDILHHNLTLEPLDWCSKTVVTNLPFSIWDDCIEKLLEHCDTVITIGRLNYLSTQSRLEKDMWLDLDSVFAFSRYIDYRTPERDDGMFNVGAMATAWFVFKRKCSHKPVIDFVDVQPWATLGNIPKEEDDDIQMQL